MKRNDRTGQVHAGIQDEGGPVGQRWSGGNIVRIDCLCLFALSLSKGSYTLRQAQGERISA